MKIWQVVGFLAVLSLIGLGCGEKSSCPKGYNFINDVCCIDLDDNGVCDAEQTVKEEVPAQGPVAGVERETETVSGPVEKVSESWDTAKISVVGYVCSNKSIAVNLKNNLPNSVTIERIRLGTAYAKALPDIMRKGQMKDFELDYTGLEKGKPIKASLFIQYNDLVTKKTKYLGPRELEGTC